MVIESLGKVRRETVGEIVELPRVVVEFREDGVTAINFNEGEVFAFGLEAEVGVSR